jgi:hypothetical protein
LRAHHEAGEGKRVRRLSASISRLRLAALVLDVEVLKVSCSKTAMSALRWRTRRRKTQGVRLLEELNALNIGQPTESKAEHVCLRESELVFELVEVRAVGFR